MAPESRVRRTTRHRTERVETTLLELFHVVSEVAQDEREVIATIHELLASGRVRLTRSFLDDPTVH